MGVPDRADFTLTYDGTTPDGLGSYYWMSWPVKTGVTAGFPIRVQQINPGALIHPRYLVRCSLCTSHDCKHSIAAQARFRGGA